ncbi:MAG: ParB/RepB/Spo0J family partition protein [Bacteroidales bacterium]
MNAKKKALGKGLGALLENPDTDITTKGIESGKYVAGSIAEIEIGSIEANPFQPRSEFEEDGLQELSQSIKEQGIIQPLTVRKIGYEKYQLISGERRLRASRLAGLKKVPSFIRIANDQQMLEMSLVENIQRRDLNAIEVAISYQRLMEECSLTQEKLSGRMGKKRSTITNYLRLLKLPPDVQVALRDGQISMGHARAILNVKQESKQTEILETIIRENLSVRQVEDIVKNLSARETKKPSRTKKQMQLPEEYLNATKRLSNKLGQQVAIKSYQQGKGNIAIAFSSDQQLQDLLKFLENIDS